jgi:hypothetical protein
LAASGRLNHASPQPPQSPLRFLKRGPCPHCTPAHERRRKTGPIGASGNHRQCRLAVAEPATAETLKRTARSRVGRWYGARRRKRAEFAGGLRRRACCSGARCASWGSIFMTKLKWGVRLALSPLPRRRKWLEAASSSLRLARSAASGSQARNSPGPPGLGLAGCTDCATSRTRARRSPCSGHCSPTSVGTPSLAAAIAARRPATAPSSSHPHLRRHRRRRRRRRDW